ncbi:DUF2958 domain-containing protein [Sphingobium aromaticiconvertens]|uniref:DUF2958 domain-containing protein n=1 Tax=Sphingobium aromaticiconvertens TaxID=365341 RepID=UPI0030191BE8
MILLTRTQRAQLLANGRQSDVDHIPVVKFYNPLGTGVWLATELDEDGDIMFGLADIGYPELGSWCFGELEAIRLPLGMAIERDVLFTGLFPISIWAEAARMAGSIRAAEQILSARFRSGAARQLDPADTENRKA